jgi:DnaJ-class molecular chaperone
MENNKLPDFAKIMKLAQRVASQIEPPPELREKGRVLTEEEMNSAIAKITKSVTDAVRPDMFNDLTPKKDKKSVPVLKQESKITFSDKLIESIPEEKIVKKKRVVEIDSEESEDDVNMHLRTKDMTFTLSVSLEELYNGCKKKIAMRRQKIENGEYIEEKKKLSIKIEPGMIEEQTVRFNHLADEIKGYETGDIVVTLDVEEHPYFIRDGNNLIIEKEISLYEIFNPVVYVKHLNGKMFKITGDSLDFFNEEDGMIKKVVGAGMPILGEPGSYGDLFIKFKCVNKTKITPEIIEIFLKYFPPLTEEPASSSDTIIEEKTFESVTESDLEFMDSDYSDSESETESDYSDSDDLD